MTQYKEWHLPLSEGDITVGDALSSLSIHTATSPKIPWIVRLCENPKYNWINNDIFPGAVDIDVHDIIHVLLGRGLMPKDEAFVIGYTMGSTQRMTNWRKLLFMGISSFIYPSPYRFDNECERVFEWGMRCGELCKVDLSKICAEDIIDKPINLVRNIYGINVDMLNRQYTKEATEYPFSVESVRSAS